MRWLTVASGHKQESSELTDVDPLFFSWKTFFFSPPSPHCRLRSATYNIEVMLKGTRREAEAIPNFALSFLSFPPDVSLPFPWVRLSGRRENSRGLLLEFLSSPSL